VSEAQRATQSNPVSVAQNALNVSREIRNLSSALHSGMHGVAMRNEDFLHLGSLRRWAQLKLHTKRSNAYCT